VLRSSRETTLCVCEDSAEAQKSESLEDSKGAKLRRNRFLCTQSRTHSHGVRGDEAKVEAFEDLEFSQGWEESAAA
jgi:hypothetical protein